jgi:predicted ArsR family transcriptional regulator
VRTLQQSGYVAVTKSFQAGRPITTYHLTDPGRLAFRDYINLLERIIDQHRESSGED